MTTLITIEVNGDPSDIERLVAHLNNEVLPDLQDGFKVVIGQAEE